VTPSIRRLRKVEEEVVGEALVFRTLSTIRFLAIAVAALGL
jgi:hypothetical protein